jgi:hypothetical protein
LNGVRCALPTRLRDAYFILEWDVQFALCRDQGRDKVFFRKIVMIARAAIEIPKTTAICGG